MTDLNSSNVTLSNILTVNGSVGIGTTVPREILDVTGNIVTAWDDRRMGIQFGNGTQYFLGMETSA